MGDANIAGPKDDGFGAERDHAGSFGAEGHCTGRLVCGLLEEFNQFRSSLRFEAVVGTIGINLACELRIITLQIRNRGTNFIKNVIGFLTRNRAPFQSESAFAGNDVLRSAAVDEADVNGREWWIEVFLLILFQLLSNCFYSFDHSRRAKDCKNRSNCSRAEKGS